jgi:hypothetical protein
VNNFKGSNHVRRYKAYVSLYGTTQLHLRNPYIIACWSVAFPGFGHLLLSKYIRGALLLIWEIFINQQTKLNSAMVYSFIGDIESAKAVLSPRLLYLYIPVYLFAIWDSYRTTVDLNKITLLAEKENAPFNSYSIGAFEINYLDKRSPITALLWSMTIPSMGQLYIHRIFIGFFTLVMTVIVMYLSHFLEALHYVILGDIEKSTGVLDAQWLLYFPSLYFFSIYDSYTNTVENNKLYENEQKTFLKQKYQPSSFQIRKGRKVY